MLAMLLLILRRVFHCEVVGGGTRLSRSLLVMISDLLLMSGTRQPGEVVAVKVDDWSIDVPVGERGKRVKAV